MNTNRGSYFQRIRRAFGGCVASSQMPCVLFYGKRNTSISINDHITTRFHSSLARLKLRINPNSTTSAFSYGFSNRPCPSSFSTVIAQPTTSNTSSLRSKPSLHSYSFSLGQRERDFLVSQHRKCRSHPRQLRSSFVSIRVHSWFNSPSYHCKDLVYFGRPGLRRHAVTQRHPLLT